MDIHKLRGQCYDGARTMSGAKSGVAKQILMEEPLAFIHTAMGMRLIWVPVIQSRIFEF